ncbi:hypothetical protein A3F07_01710 [candidate division WWE3 bacterium RIFCSPHIGHO2_12_FULL_38_15]|uniref:Glyoxalase-like domain-containing protein n=1 Tax=candidate division WWE3 bacterium RIFCSPHIGHO2_02_FULL_38_14 TaxID=1802620 RepID=A0A1F4V8S5_UNCKA|nr:MAG: hypothetical protein A2793_01590 [candidate division WWE3 bacterium RIFCSPHIGHO2_01_FULL_38_45]OGC48420.1 MAG: hypothetical protein A3F07_01710 [candidate division WWE3 bacterium RIFCSPHIGHO2_12_FULL_38_15]OGC53605.1 MAG: hypothetical protein A3D91_04145 [candidate division WWE3 bacterium RIFCSPHIGHO2_02_FULL_38_14]OGC54353.1 MAG: hypothetical protein A3B64_02505 [candidate division WWE3 bacterium RIFCSPLOWO2_01_FULL_37_24]HLB51598.1 VOC family protein [Patescibacteria group bacterium]
MQSQVVRFLDNLLQEIKNTGIDVGDLKIDHIAYSTRSSEEYERLLPEFLKEGELVKEAIISNRRVAVIKLNNPIKYKNHLITAMELIEPIEGEKTFSGWEHAEFLVDDYDNLINKYSSLEWITKNKNRENFSRIKLVLPSGREVKFLNTPVLVSATIEE